MTNSSKILQQRIKVPENHVITIRIPDEIPVNASIEVQVSIPGTRQKKTLHDSKSAVFETSIASESSLKKDWDRREEDRAWENL